MERKFTRTNKMKNAQAMHIVQWKILVKNKFYKMVHAIINGKNTKTKFHEFNVIFFSRFESWNFGARTVCDHGRLEISI